MVNLGLVGSGFVSTFYMQALRDVPGQRVVANFSRDLNRARRFGQQWGIPHQHDDLAELCNRDDIDLVVLGIPNDAHVDAVQTVAGAGKALVCTKPLGRNAEEAGQMLRTVRDAGVMAGYAETEVFCPAVMRVKEMIDGGALGRVLTVRSREAHSGPHAPQFWDLDAAGGGSLLDMGCHTVEVARYFFGKDLRPKEVFAWGDLLHHSDKTRAEDNAVLMLKFEDGRLALCETSWTMMGGMELRNEVYGTEGRAITDTTRSNVRAFTSGAGYVLEKAGTDVGWIEPIPDEARVYGYHEELRHFVECVATGAKPREDFVDGYVVNCVIDAGYRSMKSGGWEFVHVDEALVGR